MAKHKNSLTLSAKLPTDDEISRMFGSVATIHKGAIGRAAMKAAAGVIVNRASALAPRSTPSDRKKRSKKQAASADWTSVPLHTTVDEVTRQYDAKTIAVIGPAFPHGNKAYFNQPRKRIRKHVLWGKQSPNASRVFIAQRNWIVQSFDETLPAQMEAIKSELTKSVDEVMKNG